MDLKKNPKLVYLLVVLVIAIWATIFIKVFSVEPSSVHFVKSNVLTKEAQIEMDEKEVYELYLDYVDPFLGKGKVSRKSVNSTLEQQNESKLKGIDKNSFKAIERQFLSTQPVIPTIKYHGMFCNASKNKKIAILEVDNARMVMEEGEVNNELSVSSVHMDSIVLVWSGHELVYKMYP